MTLLRSLAVSSAEGEGGSPPARICPLICSSLVAGSRTISNKTIFDDEQTKDIIRKAEGKKDLWPLWPCFRLRCKLCENEFAG